MAFIPFPCPFTVISQMESNDDDDDKVPSMSKKYIFILFMHGKHSVRDVWTSQPFSRLLFRTFCALENQQTTQNKRRVPRLEGAQTYKLLCVVVESSNGQQWVSSSLSGFIPKTMRRKAHRQCLLLLLLLTQSFIHDFWHPNKLVSIVLIR